MLAPILAVGVDVDAANESAVSGVLKVTLTFGLFLLSTFSNFGIVGTKSVTPATTVEKLHLKKDTNSRNQFTNINYLM